MSSAHLEFDAPDDDTAPASVHPDLGDVRQGDQGAAVDADESEVPLTLFEHGQWYPNQV